VIRRWKTCWRMTGFWLNHLNVFVGKGSMCGRLSGVRSECHRGHALGRFEDLLLASARHPAMLYLDRAQSKRCGPEQNYARG
jgi:uncharacterized protein (DUF1800 family)